MRSAGAGNGTEDGRAASLTGLLPTPAAAISATPSRNAPSLMMRQPWLADPLPETHS